MHVRHIVFWTLKENADGHTAAENAQRILEGYKCLKEIPSVLNVYISINILPTSTLPAQVVLQSLHNSPEDLHAYAVHPAHLEFAKLIKTVCENRQALDYWVE